MSAIVWSTSPSDLADAIEKWGEKILAAAKAAATQLGPLLVQNAQAGAPWTDQTGDARAGLDHTEILSDAQVTIVLYHSVYYGIFLEVCNGGKYRIIAPTIIEVGPMFWTLLKALL